MIEVHSMLFVGNQLDYDGTVSGQSGWAVVHACKEPYHRQALGYHTPGAPKNHPEYLIARRGNRLILNLVDAENPMFFNKGMISQSLDFIDQQRTDGLNVLVHCNQGESRGPAIALVYMAARLRVISTDSLEEAEREFSKLYPYYNPKMGIRGHLQQYWREYCDY